MRRLSLFLTVILTVTGWAAYTAPNEDTVHFVGGLGTHSGADSDNGGGATEVVAAAGSPSDFMGPNGGPVTSTSNGAFDYGDKTITATGIGIGVTAGTLCGLDDGAAEASFFAGIYEVTTVTDNVLTFADISLSGADTDQGSGVYCYVGGSFPDLQSMVNDSSTNAVLFNREIYVNDPDNSITISSTITIDAYGGGSDGNTWVKIIGCDTDMAPLTNGNYLTLDAENNDLAGSIIKIVDVDNIWFENIYVKDNHNKADSTDRGFEVRNVGYYDNYAFKNCKATNCYDGMMFYDTKVRAVSIVNCHFEDCYQGLLIGSIGCTVERCFFKDNTSTGVRWGSALKIEYSTFVGGPYGAYMDGTYYADISNCNFYNQTTSAIQLDDTSMGYKLVNNIVWVTDAANDRALYRVNGSIHFEDYNFTNCTKSDGLFSGTNSLNGDVITTADYVGFVDPDNDDFRLKTTSKLLNQGMPTLGNGLFANPGYSTPGAWQRQASLGDVRRSGNRLE